MIDIIQGTSWFDELKKVFKENHDDFDKMVTTMNSRQLHTIFNVRSPNRLNLAEGQPLLPAPPYKVTVWSDECVYFLECHGDECSLQSLPRHPPLWLENLKETNNTALQDNGGVQKESKRS